MAWLISSQETPKIAHFALPLSLSSYLLLPGESQILFEKRSFPPWKCLLPFTRDEDLVAPFFVRKHFRGYEKRGGATLTRVGKIVQTCSPLEKLRFTKEISRVWKESCSQVLENSLRYVYIRVWFPLRAAFSFVLLFLGDGQLSKLKFSV